MIELKLNNTDAGTIGVKMGKGFLDALLAPKPLKEFVSNESRLEDGVRTIVPSTPKIASRDVTLTFQITGSNSTAFNTNKAAFFALLYAGSVTIEVPQNSSEKFKLIYVGNAPAYKGGLSGYACKVTVKFNEPNPNDRS